MNPGDRVRLNEQGRGVNLPQHHDRVGTMLRRHRDRTQKDIVFVLWDGLKREQGWYEFYLERVEGAEAS